MPQLAGSLARSLQPAPQQVCAPVHAAAPWHPQPLAVHAFEVRVLHAWQAMPPVPHVLAYAGVVHVPLVPGPPAQQPPGHVFASHVQTPVSQPLPAAHAAHAAPLIPQVVTVDVWHWPLASQHPSGHDVASQTHLPAVPQRWPVAHAPHDAPALPHTPFVSLAYATHVFPLQHPPGHDAALHTHVPAVVQAWPAAHAAHAAPFVPHAAALSAVMHWPLVLQQPFGHVVWSQTHLPCALHSWLAGQAWQVTPPTPHAEVLDPTHLPVPSQHPAHETLPQVHAPPEQACPAAQAPHALPWLPHVVPPWADWATTSCASGSIWPRRTVCAAALAPAVVSSFASSTCPMC